MNLFTKVTDLADIHCHIIPYVDDGVSDLEDAQKLILEEYSQGVRLLVMTPHLRYGMFDTPIERVNEQFNNLREFIDSAGIDDFDIMYSREYYCDKRFENLLDGYTSRMEQVDFEGMIYKPRLEIIPFGEHNCILLEFSSSRIQEDDFEIFINKAFNAGLTPIVAHVERYPAIQKRPTIVDRMIDQGAYIQVNCDSLLSKKKTIESETAKLLVREGKVDIISSDAHDLSYRSPNLKKCYLYVSRNYGKKTADDLFWKNACFLVYNR